MTTATEKKQDLEIAKDALERYRYDITNLGALLIISEEFGKGTTDYFRVTIAAETARGIELGHLTWSIGKALGYSLRDRSGRWYLALNGYGYSKADEIARSLADYYRIDRIRYETL